MALSTAKPSLPAARPGCPCSLSSYPSHRALGPARSYLSVGPSGAAGRRPRRIGIRKSLSCLCLQWGNGPLCPATWVNPLASPWLTQLAVSCRQGTGSSFCSHPLRAHGHFPKGDSDLKAGERAKRHSGDTGRLTASKQERNTHSSGGVQRIFQEYRSTS